MKYKLRQDMLGISAGTILRFSKHGRLIQNDDKQESNSRISLSIRPEDYPEWFELIQDRNTYWLQYWMSRGGETGTADDLVSVSKKLVLSEHQSQLVLQAIEELLRYIDTPLPLYHHTAAESPRDKDYPSGNYIAKADAAREALSS